MLGGGGGWAKSIRFENRVRDAFAAFFAGDTLTLGVCNGCQMLAQIKELIPGARNWPRFVGNRSERFEARTVLVRVGETGSPLADRHDRRTAAHSRRPHGRRAGPSSTPESASTICSGKRAVALQFADGGGSPSMRYPHNPNGSEEGLAGVVAAEGRVLATMPHPERVFRAVQNSWVDDSWGEDGPWLRLFRNARRALG